MSKDKWNHDDLDRLPISVQEFIALVIKKMRYRRKVRDEVRAELAGHFDDALRDCASDDQKENTAKELIAAFGDAKLLGKLMRRAKKRCRPLWAKAMIRGLQGIGILILVFIAYTAWFITGKPTIRVDYVDQWNAMTRPEADEAQNAWPYYQKAIALYVEPDKEIEKLKGKFDGPETQTRNRMPGRMG